MKILRIALFSIVLSCISLPAQAMPVTVGYEGVVSFVDGDSNPFWDFDVDDTIAGSFYFDEADIGGTNPEFIDSTYAPAGPGIDFIHDFFDVSDTVDVFPPSGGLVGLEIINVGGFSVEASDGGAVLLEGIFAAFDTAFFDELERNGSIWLGTGDFEEGNGILATLFSLDDVEGESTVGFDLTALHIEIGETTSLSEPGTFGLFAIGLIGAGLARRKKAA